MNLKKIAAGAVASAMAISALAISASADHLYYPDEATDPALEINGGNWLYIIYNSGGGLGDKNPTITDRNFDPWDIAKISIYGEIMPAEGSEFTLEDYDESIDGVFSGTMIYSANSGYYGKTNKDSPIYDEESGITYYSKFNWPSYEYYGQPHEGDTYEGRSEDTGGAGTNTGWCDWTKSMVPVYLKPFNYEFTMDIPDDMRWPTPADESEMAGLYRVGYGAWADMAEFVMKINLMILRDDDGNILLATDGLGYDITPEEAEAKVVELSTPSAGDSSSDEPSGGDNGSGDSSDPSGGDSSDSGNNASDSNNNASNDSDSATTTTTTSYSYEASGDNSTLFIILGIVAAVIVVIVVIVVVIKKKKS